jgi:predicted O-methyltransferase YrrM
MTKARNPNTPRRAGGIANPGEAMSEALWNAVDDYVAETILHADPALAAALAASDAAGLPSIAVSAPQGKQLHLIARMIGARRILEIGTLGGYSAIWMASALPKDGKLVTLEADPKHADVARANLERAGLAERSEVVVGKALDTLPGVAARRDAPFDLAFIDADKANIPAYFDHALAMSRAGSVIVVDNTVREGKLADANTGDAAVDGVRALHAKLAKETRVSATTIQTVGVKGYDGFTIALVTAGPSA